MPRASALSAGSPGAMFSCIFRRSGQADFAACRKAKQLSFRSPRAPRAYRPKTYRSSKGDTYDCLEREITAGQSIIPQRFFSQGNCTTYREFMKNIKFVVKVNRGGSRGVEYVQRIDRKPIQTTLRPNLALIMGRFTAQDVVESLGKSRWSPELVAVGIAH